MAAAGALDVLHERNVTTQLTHFFLENFFTPWYSNKTNRNYTRHITT